MLGVEAASTTATEIEIPAERALVTAASTIIFAP
jgi:hypothetical protein